MKILIRCDGGDKKGLGHISRCSVLAGELARNSIAPQFLIKTDAAGKVRLFLQSRKLDHLKADFLRESTSLRDERSVMSGMIENGAIELVLLDHYRATTEYCREIKSMGVKLIQFDYTADPDLVSDIILNPNPGAVYVNYDKQISSGQKVLGGLKYALIDDAFTQIKNRKSREDDSHILFALGGSEKAANFIKRAVEILDGFELHTFFIPALPETETLNQGKGRFSLIRGYDDYLNAVETAGIVVCNAGVTASEMLYLDKKMVILNMADNQKLNLRFFSENLGHTHSPDEFLKLLKNNPDIFARRFEKPQPSSVRPDGKGAKRVVEEIKKLMES
jgi:UDP-2,4-diacetamido-2,4,6-trideoxy-beta-L-altropyranose hydrolase